MQTTSTNWLESLRRLTPADKAVLITVTAVKGSTPRGAGTRMLVTANTQYDTIGGGHLEWKAIASARLWLAETSADATPRHIDLSLGPSLGQCCGGALSLCLERVDCWSYQDLQHKLHDYQQEQARLPHLYLFGAGHVGTALVNILQYVPCRITWVDERDHLFPTELPDNIITEATDTPEAVISSADKDAYFLVMTHHHGLDLILSEHILRQPDVAWFGLIGSKTKRARFENRLQERGIGQHQRPNMVCPIGVSGISGKEPGVIAVAVAAQLLQLWAKRPTLSPIATLTRISDATL
ncbi:xanthine dehydrogenase accessory protein XdhC [Undibacterium sp. RuRC25W]|uniref:xanthine dehydrogenase accessory protein XdhC n=1 Tax=Undibacterium sp. RuRC25W TaxID=3413047 RepID=UPI003BF17E9D